jgi:hypothetical protein
MVRSLSLVAALVSLLMLSPGAMAQEKYELTGIIGRTFVSDQGVTGVVTPDTILHSGKGLTFEANIARHLLQGGLVGLSVEVPFAVNFDQDVHFSVNLVPRDYKSFFVTPSIRANVFPGAGLSPWVSAGGGFGYFNENATLEFGGTNPGKTGTSTGVFQIGGGIDVKILPRLSVRGQVRDFFSGIPQLNVDTGKSRQHNLFVGGGVIWHF